MPYQDLNIKQKVKVGEKYGQIVECGDKYKVKFDDGSFGFYDGNEVTPIVLDTESKGYKRFMRMKSEAQLKQDEVFMQPTAQGTDPLAQPINSEGVGIGENHSVLGKEASVDRFTMKNGEIEMAKKKVIDEEIEAPEESEEEEEKKKMKKEEEEKPEDEVEKESSEEEQEDDKDDKEEVEKDEDEDEDEEEKKKKLKKGEESGENPEEDTASATDDNSTITPNLSVPSQSQDVFVPPSDVDGKREQETPMGKSVNPDLMKSPLFVSLSSQIDGIRDAVSKKVDALEKSVNDRLNNVLKDMAKVEKFYKQSFYKAIDENVAPEGIQQLPLSKQIEAGKIRFRNK